MGQPNPTQTVTNPRIGKLIELETAGRIKPEHQTELDTYRAQGLAPQKKGGGADATVEERKASSFLTRAIGANQSYEKTGVGPRSMIGQWMAAEHPDFLNTLPEWVGNSDERQISDSAQDEFVAASLRQDSGAAIPPDELENQKRIYFPMPGDNDAVIAQKRAARLRAIDGLVNSSGRSLTAAQKALIDQFKDDIEKARRGEPVQSDKAADPSESLGAGESGDYKFPDQIAEPHGWRLTQEQQDGYTKFMRANAQWITPDMIAAWAKANNVPAPDNADVVASSIRDYIAKGGDPEKIPTQYNYEASDKAALESARKDLGGFNNPVVNFGVNVADIASFSGLDEGVGAARSVLYGTDRDKEIDDTRARIKVLSEDNPVSSFAGTLAGGALLPFKAGSAASMAKQGAILGGLYGIGSGTSGNDRFVKGLGGAVTGGLLGYGGGRLAERFGAGRTPPPEPPAGGTRATPQDVIAAADRQGVDVLPADVGGPMVGRISDVTSKTPFGVKPIVTAAETQTDQAAAAASRAAGGIAPDGFEAGRAAQRGMEKHLDATKSRAGKLYDDIPIDDATDAALDSTKGALGSVNNRLSSNDELAAVMSDSKMQRIEKALVGSTESVPTGLLDSSGNMMTRTIQKGGKLSWKDLKQFRTMIGERLNSMAFQSDTAQSDLKALYGALSADMEKTAAAQGPEALAKFKLANRYWRARQDNIERVATAILGTDGKKGAQEAFNQINRWATTKGETAKLASMMRSMPADDANTIAAGVIDLVGKAKPGQQNAAGDAFSLGTFLTNWNKLDPRAKSALFSKGQRAALEDLAVIAEGTKAGQRFASTGSAGANVGMMSGAATTSALTAFLSGHPFMAIIAALPVASQRPLGKLLASPVFARWLANAPARAEQRAAHMAKLNKIATSNPAIANDIAEFERHLINAMNDNAPLSSAASERRDEKGKGQ